MGQGVLWILIEVFKWKVDFDKSCILGSFGRFFFIVYLIESDVEDVTVTTLFVFW